MNNRKRTAGRNYQQVQIEKILGYTIRVKHGTMGYKSHLDFKKFIPVSPPDLSEIKGQRLTNRMYKFKRRLLWEGQIAEAHRLAGYEASKQNFECIIIPKIEKTSIKVFN